ncbi:MAG: anaerobic ribonucleoside-triphosphate reductase [Eubacteriales bacterium]|nr:anaerobic ribonucleoside-triphosphate reductase [Eubacteriales bacterium]
MKINVTGGTLSQHEIDIYVAQLKDANPDKYIKTIDFTVDGEFVDVNYTYDNVPFERIRRITGYLVGTVDRFNNGKRAEVEDRVTHSLATSCALEEIA